MADKMSWTELRRTIAARAGVSEKEANAFLNALQAQLKEALKNDKQVKVNGLGTFRLQAVAPRKSVNVSTGEEIIIEGYNKIVFAPEAGVRELIEKGGENIVLDQNEQPSAGADPIQKLGAQAEEIVGILGELGQSPKEEEPAEPTPPLPEKEEESAAEEPEVPEVPMADPAEAFNEPEKPAEPVVEPAPVYTPSFVREPETVEEPAPQKPKKKSHFFRDVLICLLVLLLLLGILYYFFRPQINAKLESLLTFWPKQTEEVVPVAADTTAAVIEPEQEIIEEANPNIASIPEGSISQEQILAEFLEASKEDEEEEITGLKENYPGIITIEPIHEGSRLTWMAKRYYGSKTYWPYIFDANRDILPNPSLITVGTPIRVPKLSAAQRDTTNAQTRQRLESLRREAEELSRN